MSKRFLLAIIVGLIALGIFVYFIFGFNQKPSYDTIKAVEENNTKSTMNDDLKIEDTQIGEGKEVKSGDTVTIHYKGILTNGTKFDSSYDRGQPFETQIGVGQVIKGWDLGVVGMKVGGKRKLTIPPALGYGNQDLGVIPPNSTLTFEVELIDVK